MAVATFTDHVSLACPTSSPVVLLRGQEPQCLTMVQRTNHTPVCGQTVTVHARSQSGFGTSGRPEPKIRCTNASDLIY